MNWIEVNGTSLRYELSGSGKTTLLLVHEMGGTLDSWDQVLPALNNSRQVLRYDTRGAGLSAKIHGKVSFDDMADDLAALLDATGTKGTVALAGTAVGGAIAIHFAVRHAARAGVLVVTSPATGVAADRRQATLDRAAAAERDGMRALVEQGTANAAGGSPQRRGVSQIPRALAGQRSGGLRRDQPHARGFHRDRGTAAHRLSHAGDLVHARQVAATIRGRADGETDSRRRIPGDQFRTLCRHPDSGLVSQAFHGFLSAHGY